MLRRRDLAELTGVHHRHLVGQRQRLALVVGDEHTGSTADRQCAHDRAPGLLAQAGVERGERLIEEHEAGSRRQGPRQRHALLLAT